MQEILVSVKHTQYCDGNFALKIQEKISRLHMATEPKTFLYIMDEWPLKYFDSSNVN